MNLGNFENREPLNMAGLVEALRRDYPKFWKRFCPRRYRNVERYQDYRMLNAILCTTVAYIDAVEIDQIVSDMQTFGIIAATGTKNDFPLFFVSPEMFLAASATAPPDEIDWQTMPLPFEFMTFVLPKSIAKIKDEEIVAIQFTRCRKGFHHIPETDKNIFLTNDMLYIDIINTSGMRYLRHLTKPYLPGSELPNTSNGEYQRTLDGNENELTNLLTHVAFNLIFAMAARPELLTKGTRSGTHKKSKQEIWSPNIIGEHFKISRPPVNLGGTHASPRLHWRRGHFRRQAVGTGRLDHKMIWLEPCLVGVKSAEV